MAPPGENLARGIRHFNEGRFRPALAEFERAIAADSAAVDARLLKAFCLLSLNDAVGARREMEATLKLFPASAPAASQAGAFYARLGELDKAADLARRAAELAPESVEARLREASALAAAGRPSEALAALRRAVRASPRSALLWSELAQAHLRFGQSRKALRCARLAARLDPSSARAAGTEASALENIGAPRDALTALRRALRLSPPDAELCAQAARLHARSGTFEASVEFARRAARLDPACLQAYLQEAFSLSALGRRRQALAPLRRALRAAPLDPELWCEIAAAHIALKEWPAALRCARRAAKLDPKSPQASRLEASVHANRGRPLEAAAALRRALRASPADLELWISLAKAEAADGGEPRARAALLKASALGLTAEPLRGVVAHLVDRARGLMDRRSFAKAGQFLRLALECFPNDPELWFRWGVLMRRQTRLEEADAAYAKVCELRPDHLDAYLHRAESLMYLGRVGAVARVLREARARCPAPAPQDLESWAKHYRLAASLFDFDEAARIGESLLNKSRRFDLVEKLCWPVLTDDFELVPRPPAFLRLAEAALKSLPASGKAALWGRFLCMGFALQPGSRTVFKTRALAESSFLARFPRSRYGWMRYVAGCLRMDGGENEAALADFRTAYGATNPPNWLAFFHQQELLLRLGRRAEALRGLKRAERLVPPDRERDFLIKKGWFHLSAGQSAKARTAFRKADAGADSERGLRAVRSAATQARRGRAEARPSPDFDGRRQS